MAVAIPEAAIRMLVISLSSLEAAAANAGIAAESSWDDVPTGALRDAVSDLQSCSKEP